MSKQQKINEFKRTHFKHPYPRPERNQSRNSPEHELVKALVVYVLQKAKKEVYAEAEWVGGGMADVVVPEDNLYIEVLHSETDKMLKNKCLKYPDIDQMVVRVSDVWFGDVKETVKLIKEILI